jgi:uncharacterized protein YjbJ (UPF0337 family)
MAVTPAFSMERIGHAGRSGELGFIVFLDGASIMSQAVAMPNAQQIAGVWNKLKGKFREKWGQLTDEDLEQFKGNVDQLVGHIQQRTGMARAEIEAFLSDSFEAASGMMEKAREKVGEFTSRAGQALQEQYQSASNKIGETSDDAQEFIRSRPAESIGIAFGVGFVSGVLLTMMLRSR